MQLKEFRKICRMQLSDTVNFLLRLTFSCMSQASVRLPNRVDHTMQSRLTCFTSSCNTCYTRVCLFVFTFGKTRESFQRRLILRSISCEPRFEEHWYHDVKHLHVFPCRLHSVSPGPSHGGPQRPHGRFGSIVLGTHWPCRRTHPLLMPAVAS